MVSDTSPPPTTSVDFHDLQGNILRGYRLKHVRHMILEVTDRAAARAFLAASVAGSSPDVPKITHERPIEETAADPTLKPGTAFNVAFTFAGLKALRLSASHLASFPTEFIEGMHRRGAKLNDFGNSDPSQWSSPFDQPGRVHILASAYANSMEDLNLMRDQTKVAFNLLGALDGWSQKDGKVFFGYHDGLSQPRFEGFHQPDTRRKEEPLDYLGTVLVGLPTRLQGLKFAVPSPSEFGSLGTFNAFRVLEQDCWGFEDFLDQTVQQLEVKGITKDLVGASDVVNIYPDLVGHAALREVIAAQLCGRWRNGLAMQYEKSRALLDSSKVEHANDFDYGDGAVCPVGSHIRRNNPRGGAIVQRIANFTRRLVRRGMSYGDDFKPQERDDKKRGLLGNFIGASLGAQFEAVMCDWLNLGLSSPEITGSNDPLIGANTKESSWFDLNLWLDEAAGTMIKHRIYGLPRFVTTRGGAYAFIPTLTGIRYLSRLSG